MASDLDYLQRIHDKHEEWLNCDKHESASKNTLIIDNTIPINQEKIVDFVSNWLSKRTETRQVFPEMAPAEKVMA